MKTTMTIIPCDGSPETKREVEFKNDTPSYEELRALVEPAIPSLNGGHAFERVNVWLNNCGRHINSGERSYGIVGLDLHRTVATDGVMRAGGRKTLGALPFYRAPVLIVNEIGGAR